MAMYVNVNQMHHLEMWTKVECLEYTQIDDRILYKSLSIYIADCQFSFIVFVHFVAVQRLCSV